MKELSKVELSIVEREDGFYVIKVVDGGKPLPYGPFHTLPLAQKALEMLRPSHAG